MMITTRPKQRPEPADTRIKGWFTPENHAFLEAALEASAGSIVEIGSWMGRSTRFMAQRAPWRRIYCLDTWEGGQEHQGLAELEELEDRFWWNVWDYRHIIFPVKGRSQDSLKAMQGIQVGLVYIDGSHETEDVFWDVMLSRRNWPDAIIVGDDWQMASVRAGVHKALAMDRDTMVVHDRNAWRIVKRSEMPLGFGTYWKLRAAMKKILAVPARYYSGIS